jgi:hypothetical protein
MRVDSADEFSHFPQNLPFTGKFVPEALEGSAKLDDIMFYVGKYI